MISTGQLSLEFEIGFESRFPRFDLGMPTIERFINISIHTIVGETRSDYPRGYGRGWHEIVDEFVLIADMLWDGLG